MTYKISTPCRIHIGLIDLNGELGRINGGLGVGLETPGWEIQAGYTLKKDSLSELTPEYRDLLPEIKRIYDQDCKTDSSEIKFSITKRIPDHVGLGSKTQFLMAIGLLLNYIHDKSLSLTEIARIVKRGGTSGIGVGTFRAGGIILDGGHKFGPDKETCDFLPSSASKAAPPPILFRHYPAENWRFVIITPKGMKGAFGKKEIELFQSKCPIPAVDVEKLSRLILMKILPAAVENDIKLFGEGITEVQTKFEKFGLECYDETIVEELLSSLREKEQVFGSGLSSFGPTVFALTNSEKDSQKVISSILENYKEKDFEILQSSKISYKGAKIDSISK